MKYGLQTIKFQDYYNNNKINNLHCVDRVPQATTDSSGTTTFDLTAFIAAITAKVAGTTSSANTLKAFATDGTGCNTTLLTADFLVIDATSRRPICNR